MGNASVQQHAFNGGEWSPLMFGRQDVDKYPTAMAKCFNSFPVAQGPWTRRPGTVRLISAANGLAASPLPSYLHPFTYSTLQTYMLEFGDQVVRFYTGANILTKVAQNLTNATQASPCTVTYAGADTYANGERVFITDVLGMTQLNNREYTVANVNVGANTFELSGVNSTGYDAYTSGGSIAEIVTLTTPYLQVDLADIRVTQTADVLYIFHPAYQTRKIIRTSATTWTLNLVNFLDGPYMPLNATATTLTPSAATGAGITITASAVTGINDDQGFLTTDVGRLIRMREGSVWGYVKITAWTSTTVVTADVINTLTNINPKVNWRLGMWSDTTGWPATGAFHEDRLVAGGSTAFPEIVSLSQSGDYENMAPTDVSGVVSDSDAMKVAFRSSEVNPVYWFVSEEKALLVGTEAGIWALKSSSLGEALTPTNRVAKRISKFGSDSARAVFAGSNVVYVQSGKKKVRELAFNFEIDGYKVPDLTLLAEHIASVGIVKIAFQQTPQPIVWALLEDGTLIGMTYDREQNVVAWHEHVLGNPDGMEFPLVAIRDIAVQKDTSGTRDELWLVTSRTVNGDDIIQIELMTKMWEKGDALLTAFFLDSGFVAISGSPVTVIDGLYWLEGETVTILADGAAHPPKTITNGKITLDRGSFVVILGYPYTSDGQQLPLPANSPDGSGQSKLKKISRIGFRLMDTLGLKFGPDADNLQELLIRPWGTPFGEPSPLASGMFRERFPGSHDLEGQPYWRCDGPFPGTLLSIIPYASVSDDT